MTLKELNEGQRISLKQDILCKRGSPTWGDLANADALVTDAQLEDEYGDTEFCDEDFL